MYKVRFGLYRPVGDRVRMLSTEAREYRECIVAGFLVPIRVFTPHSLAAVRFALEFGKRNKGILYFLFVDDPDDAPVFREKGTGCEETRETDLVRRKIEMLIDAGKSMDGVQMETHCRSGDFMEAVRQFVHDHYITEIVVSLPEEHEDTFEQTRKDILLLLKMTHCRILTVKQKNKGLR